MASKGSIPPALEQAVLERAANGASTREIASWLGSEHGIKTSHGAVARLLERTRTERADVAKAVLRQKLTKSLTSDLDLLQKHAGQLDSLADEAATAKDIDGYSKLVDQLRKMIDTKMHYSGAGEQDGDKGSRKPVIFIPPESDD